MTCVGYIDRHVVYIVRITHCISSHASNIVVVLDTEKKTLYNRHAL